MDLKHFCDDNNIYKLKRYNVIMGKRVVSLILVTCLVLILMINSVSAIDFIEGIRSVGVSIIEILKPVAEFLLGALGGEITEELLFAKVLFFIIVLGIVWLSLKKVPLFEDKPVILNIVSLAVSILAVRGIATEELIKTVMFPSEVLGLALIAGIPFVIYFMIVNVGFKGKQYSIVRKIAWIFFAVIFVGLWIYRRTKLGDLHYIYLITVVGAVIMAGIDGTMQKFFSKIEKERFKALSTREKIVRLKNLRDDAEKQDDEVLIKYYDKKLKKLMRQ